MTITGIRYCSFCGRCYHGRTEPTSAACECGAGCATHCNCDLNRARIAREWAEQEAINAAAHAREVAAYEAEYARLAPTRDD